MDFSLLLDRLSSDTISLTEQPYEIALTRHAVSLMLFQVNNQELEVIIISVV